jgi:hypothetical protein
VRRDDLRADRREGRRGGRGEEDAMTGRGANVWDGMRGES